MSDLDSSPAVTSGASPETSGEAASSDSTGDAGSRSEGVSEGIKATIETAMSRAKETMKQEDSDGKQSEGDSISSSEQAAGKQASGDSTQQQGDSDTPGSGEGERTSDQQASDGKPDGDSTLHDSLTPPDSWPENRRKEFSSLPDSAKRLLLSIEKDMERGLKKSFDNLANQRKTLSDNFGLEADKLKDLADRYHSFQKDPVAIISQLAEEAGIDVFFQQQTEEIPDFDDQRDAVKWLRDQARNDARQAAANESKALREQRQKEEVKARMEKEFSDAYRKYQDLPDHREAVIKYISGFKLPVEMAYKLATYDGLRQLAESGQSTKAELDKAKSELEKLQKLSTMPPARADGRSNGQLTNGMDVYEHAMARAKQNMRNQS